MKKLTPIRLLYFIAAVLLFSLGALSYSQLCPTDSNACFRRYAVNGCMVLACIGFVPMYLGRAFFGTLGEGAPPAVRSRGWRVARTLFVFGSTVAISALAWFLGCIAASI